MKVAMTVCDHAVSTVCDFCDRLLIADVSANRVINRVAVPFVPGSLRERVQQLREQEVDLLLCGAISRPFEQMLAAFGIRVVSGLRGSVEDILQAFLGGGINEQRFVLPGFGAAGRCRQRRQGCGRTLCSFKTGMGKVKNRVSEG